MQKSSNQNPHCLRSKKLNDDQLLLLKHFGDQQKTNKMEYKLLEESINNLKKESRVNKKVKYSPPSIRKNSRSNNNKKVNSYTKKKNSKNLKKIRQNSDRANSGRNKKDRNNMKVIENQKILRKKNNVMNNIDKKNLSANNKNIDNENNNIIGKEQENIGKKRIGVKKLIHNYEILDIKDDNKINNEINPINNTNKAINIDFINNTIQQPAQIPKANYQTFLGNIITNSTQNINPIITANITNINRITNNFYPSSIYTPRIEVKDPLPFSNIGVINNKPTYGKIVNNKRVIFALYHRPKEDLHKMLKKKKRRRRRLKNVLNYKKYQEKLKEMPNYVNNNNEFKYLFETSHRIAKNYWHVKVDIVNSTRYVGYSDSDESYTKIRVGRKRGRKRRRVHNNNDNDDSNLAEINAISELRKNLEKTDGDVELLFNRDSLEKSSGSQSLMGEDF